MFTTILLGVFGFLFIIVLIRLILNINNGDSIMTAFKDACCLASK